MNVVFIGASGLVGKSLLSLLIESPAIQKIELITRKKININSSKIDQFVFSDLAPSTLENLQINGDTFVCSLGTTIKNAKTKQQFIAVDYGLVTAFFDLAKRVSAKSSHVISAKGANSSSLIFYNKVKGETEDYLKNLNLPSLYIYRPSLLIGEREEKRRGEEMAIKIYRQISPVLPKKLKKVIGSEVNDLAKKMAENILGHQEGIYFIESTDL